MSHPRLKAIRQKTRRSVEDALVGGVDASPVIEMALDEHFLAARPFCPDIDREVASMRAELEEAFPTTSPPPPPPQPPPPGPGDEGTDRSVRAAEAPTTSGPQDFQRTPQPLPQATAVPPPAPGPSLGKEKPMSAPPSTSVAPDVQKARDDTIADYWRLLRRNTPRDARSEALDQHAERVDSLDVDIDDELDAMENILGALGTTPPPPRPAPQSSPRSNGRPRPPLDPALIRSPFRFVPLSDVVVSGADHALDIPLPQGYCGSITVEWEAETPLLIGGTPPAGQTERDKAIGPVSLGDDETGPFVIPGSTIRGYLRAALEIIASGRLYRVNENSKFPLRDFDHPKIRPLDPDMPSPLQKDQVKAGYLFVEQRKGEDGGTEEAIKIAPCTAWHTVAIADLPGAARASNQYQWRADWLKKNIFERYRAVVPEAVEKTIDFEALRNHPKRFSRTTAAGAVGEVTPSANGEIEGVYVFSNKSPSAPDASKIKALEQANAAGQPKKREYVFVGGLTGENAFQVPAAVWSRFLDMNSRLHRNKRVPEGSWKDLEPSFRRHEVIPIFYIGDGDDLQIGLTRYFKIAHTHSIGAMRDRDTAHRPDGRRKADFVDSLFGYVREPDAVTPESDARKGRIAVEFATAVNAAPMETAITTIMGAPRPSFAPFYLSGLYKDWSSDDHQTRLAGRKRYLPRVRPGTPIRVATQSLTATLKEQKERIARASPGGTVSEDAMTHLRFLTPKDDRSPLAFKGRLRLHNVTAEEIGALLWALTHGGDPAKPCRHLMGCAKGLGAGQLRVRRLHLDLSPNNADAVPRKSPPEAWELPDGPGQEGWLTPDSWSMAPFLRGFHEFMAAWRPTWPRTPDMAEFLASADPETGHEQVAAKRMDYPMLKDFRVIRDAVKLSTRHAPPTERQDRFLPVVPAQQAATRARSLRLPYLKRD